MKLFDNTPVPIVRVSIQREGETAEHLSLCECTLVDVMVLTEKALSKLFSNQKGDKTRIMIRDSLAGKNGKAKTLTYYGLSTRRAKALLLKALEPVNHKN